MLKLRPEPRPLNYADQGRAIRERTSWMRAVSRGRGTVSEPQSGRYEPIARVVRG